MRFSSILAAAVLAATAFTSEVASAGCSTVAVQATCVADVKCQWFLGACIDKATKNCKVIKEKEECSSTPGCQFYPEPQWWVPPEYVETHYGDFKSPKIGCDENTMCKRLSTSYWCNAYSHCGWVDGACKTRGTPADPNWKADCTRHKAWRYQDCEDLGPQCKYVKMYVCDDANKECENIVYGCRKANWCGVRKGRFLSKQCAKLSATCAWQESSKTCEAVPTASPTTGAPSRSPSIAPTFRPTKAPTNAPTKSPTKAPTPRPTPPTTLAPTLRPTPPTTLSPTNKPTTAAPTKAKCPVSVGAGDLECRNHPFAQLAQTFDIPAGTVDKQYYCTELCASGGAQGSFEEPVFPGCRAWAFDGTQCRLFGCYVGGQGAYEANVVASASVTHGTLTASCYDSGKLPTPPPTTTCLYTNEDTPPAKVSNSKPIANNCKIYTSTMSAEYVGDARARLDWCQQGCTNIFGTECVSTELYAASPGLAKCVYAKCSTIQSTAIGRTIYRSQKTTVC